MSIKVAFTWNEALKHYAQQLGVNYIVAGPNHTHYAPYSHPWDYGVLREKKQEIEDAGLAWSVYEGIVWIDGAKLGNEKRDEDIAHFCTLLENMGKLGVDCVCYNWMPVWGWFRTSVNVPIQGGALVSEFNYEAVKDLPLLQGITMSADQLWTNLEYFLKKVVPVAEKAHVKLALHPDDPPIPHMGGLDRILISADAMYQATQLVQSEYNGICLCQGNFAAMGEDIPACIHRFADAGTLHFAHFRDVEGTAEHFRETWHYAGKSDMLACMKAYYDVDFQGVMRPDHVPTIYGDDNNNPGYAVLGNLVAAGYMFGLMEACEKELDLR